jgi:hypothetical protein
MSLQENCIEIESPTANKVRIGKPTPNGYLNMFCSFNPMKKLRFVQVLNNSKKIEVITVQNYENGTGGIAVRLLDGVSFEAGKDAICETFEIEVS